MKTFVYNSSTVTDLLNMLVDGRENVCWNLRCSYADGQGQTLIEIAIYEGACRSVKGLIVFNAETGETKNFRYRGYKKRSYGNIVDVLLDLINFEKYQVLETV